MSLLLADRTKRTISDIDAYGHRKVLALNISPSIRKYFMALTELGTTPGLLFLILGVSAADGRLGLVLLAVLIVSEVLNSLLKKQIRRERPRKGDDISNDEHGWSFPSAHAQNSMAILLTMSMDAGLVVGLISIVVAMLISLSRVILLKHYISDVVCGAAIGILIHAMARMLGA